MARLIDPYRLAPPLAALAAFLALGALYTAGGREIYAAIIRFWGVTPGLFGPFLDMHGLAAAWTCHRLGTDVAVSDPCDLMRRPFNYGPLWLPLAHLAPGPGFGDWLGWGCGVLFILSLFALPSAQSLFETALRVAATLSTMVVFALERGNPDLVIFMLALLIALLSARASWLSFAAYALVIVAGLLKYYPFVLLALTLRERPARFIAINLAALAAAALMAALYWSDLVRGLPLIASGSYFTDLFAAKNLPFGLAQSLAAILGEPAPSRLLAYVLYALLTLACAGLCACILRLAGLRPTLAKLTQAEAMLLAIGSLLVTGCFFAGQSIGYRGIFLLLVLPGLLAVRRHAADRNLRRLGGAASAVLVFLMWGEFFRTKLLAGLAAHGFGYGTINAAWFDFWLARELAWWFLAAVLGAVMLARLGEAGTGRQLAALLRRLGIKAARAPA
ncbi:MAG: hypothetical protein ACREFL_06690 [Stellaceae bacterium]